MKLLQTGDLHLGKIFYERPLLEDQKNILNQIYAELSHEDYTALIITGDIYDRSIPPVDAVTVFSDFLYRLQTDFPQLAVCIISGNHDSAQRLSFAREILATRNVHIQTNAADCVTPLILRSGNEQAALFMLPFLYAGALSADSETGAVELRSQYDLVKEAIDRIKNGMPSDMPSLLAAHLFTVNGTISSSERSFLGTAEQVPAEWFSDFAYTALGHLHKMQKITERCRYAGSPLAYSFDESGSQKKLLSITITPTGGISADIEVAGIPLQPLHPVTRIAGTFSSIQQDVSYQQYADHFLEITLTDNEIVLNPAALLRQTFPYLLSVRQQGHQSDAEITIAHIPDNHERTCSPEEQAVADFKQFLEMVYGTSDVAEVSLFKDIIEETGRAE